jgi:hypothetical protein
MNLKSPLQLPYQKKATFLRCLLKTSSQGSITMEYIVVSSFALLVSVSAVTWIGRLVKARIDNLAAKLGTDAGDFDISLDPTP